MDRPDWQQRAACRGRGTHNWFPPDHTNARDGKALCNTCPVRQECSDCALADLSIKGVWGGTSERERTRLRRRH